jgi:hypothetical protein
LAEANGNELNKWLKLFIAVRFSERDFNKENMASATMANQAL